MPALRRRADRRRRAASTSKTEMLEGLLAALELREPLGPDLGD